MNYLVKRIQNAAEIESCERFEINHYLWNSKCRPKTHGWLGYIENKGLYVKMVCEETDPKRLFQNHRDMVCKDSAMEIFLAFTEDGEDLSNDSMYINLEVNSNGAMYANYGKGRKNRVFLTDEEYEATGVKAVIEEDSWYLELLVPEEVLNSICDFDAVKAGKHFYCNFYKIAEDDKCLHFGAFSPIDNPTPNFHLPVFFAEAVIDCRE